ncbi:unnamed protein product [Haemonchus placei]|uniref:Uncharacterized protein n=1 Tax=Haemonchus placei TaxID=6290 RepID=A0A3P7UX59_HAEPC|nr:unnamed protein product [Haemonchus placei]
MLNLTMASSVSVLTRALRLSESKFGFGSSMLCSTPLAPGYVQLGMGKKSERVGRGSLVKVSRNARKQAII